MLVSLFLRVSASNFSPSMLPAELILMSESRKLHLGIFRSVKCLFFLVVRDMWRYCRNESFVCISYFTDNHSSWFNITSYQSPWKC